MSNLNSESIKRLVSQQLATITDPTVYEAISALLVEPVTCDLTDKQAHELVSSLNAKHASDNGSLFAIEPRTQRW